MVESIQVIDDYGDQANLTGIKTGEPDKILNITIRKDKNHGYFGQATAGDGEDFLPKAPGITNANRYIGDLKFFNFNNEQQIAVLGTINNTNVNTFTYGSATGGGEVVSGEAVAAGAMHCVAQAAQQPAQTASPTRTPLVPTSAISGVKHSLFTEVTAILIILPTPLAHLSKPTTFSHQV
ncbi:hypothetical protein ACQ86K_31265 [Mucilaginibacter sp. P19]|uniref:hypothetical protein n=1 Tax=Mucilaginibacter sp. P19 TaxID=3423947 RepID=UPI003D666421